MEGYVYIMTNVAMPGLVKIGSTKRSPEERRRELSRPSGVPANFIVAYEVFTTDLKFLEKSIQDKLYSFRVNRNKEFFKISLKDAIALLSRGATEIRLRDTQKQSGVSETFDVYEAIEILEALKAKYPGMLREGFVSVRIYQTKVRCYLETTTLELLGDPGDDWLENMKIFRMDLGYIVGNDDPENFELLFNPADPVAANARKFLEDFDEYSILMSGCEVFNSWGEEQVSKKYQSKR